MDLKKYTDAMAKTPFVEKVVVSAKREISALKLAADQEQAAYDYLDAAGHAVSQGHKLPEPPAFTEQTTQPKALANE